MSEESFKHHSLNEEVNKPVHEDHEDRCEHQKDDSVHPASESDSGEPEPGHFA